ncbi:hypothetical protein HRbin10_01028 [bacterium HR10]|nr:hypothetical protein HRbin10_01028 [bacterium HR10]
MKRVVLALAAFCLAYAGVGFIRIAITQRPREVRPKATVRVGERVVFPQLQSITGAPFPGVNARFLFVTAFSLSCPFAVQSVPFWNRIKRALPAHRASYVVIGCARSFDELRTFVQHTGLEADVFFAPCDQVEAKLRIAGGISHYLLDARHVCRAVWTGMPVNAQGEKKILDEILRALEP